MKQKIGISLIVLIITIIVVIILAAVVILTLSKNNPIESAKEARFKEDVRTFQDELALYISKQYTNAGGHWDGNISAKTYDDIVKYIPSFTKKYEGKFIINNNNLEYTNNLDDNEKEYAQSLNIKEKVKLLPDEYQQVEYLESTGTQYIDTKKIPTNYTGMKILVSNITAPKDDINFTGVRISGGNRFMFNITQYKYLCFGYGKEYKNSKNIDTNSVNTLSLNYKNNRLMYCNDDSYQFDNVNLAINLPIYIFTQNSNTGINTGIGMKVFNFQITELSSIMHNFIPCYSTTTVTDVNNNECPKGTRGMYDTVEGKFYTNQGTGEFIPGPDVD